MSDNNTNLPTKSDILEYLQSHNAPILQRDLGKALNVPMSLKGKFRDMLKDLIQNGQIDRGMDKKISAKGILNEVCTIHVTHMDKDGELIAVPEGCEKLEDAPIIYVKNSGEAKIGDHILARLTKSDSNTYVAKVVRVIADDSSTILGILKSAKGGFLMDNADKKDRSDYFIAHADAPNCEDGDMVIAVPIGNGRNRVKNAKVLKQVGKLADPNSYSLLSIFKYNIPNEFTSKILKETNNMEVPPLNDRTDLRDIPLVTIDGSDARDFDDAVYCEKAKNGGFKLLIAIADVSYYVTTGSALDDSAEERGNSVYFPDRVVPMLPEKLSNGLCSLVPNEDRGCMAVWIDIDATGEMTGYKFIRGLMRSHARLTYEQVQTAKNGNPCELTSPIMNKINVLYDAFELLIKSRKRRGTLELDLPERQVIMNEQGRITSIVPRIRLDSHKLIEEFMISANVASAKALENKKAPAIMYRVHDVPPTEKVNALQTSLKNLDLAIPTDGSLKPRHFTEILEQVKGTENSNLISDLVLRSQSQAVYSPDNLGHFGLALTHYCHFTSPIRRYSDLLVHRALISTYNMGNDGLGGRDIERFESIAEHISGTERRASKAEREAMDRYVAHFMKDKVGAEFTARINGVTGFAVFISLEETGADGIIFLKNIGGDYYAHDEATNSVIGVRKGTAYRMGDTVTVELVNISPVKGAMEFAITSGGKKGIVPDHLKNNDGGRDHRSRESRRYSRAKSDSRGNDSRGGNNVRGGNNRKHPASNTLSESPYKKPSNNGARFGRNNTGDASKRPVHRHATTLEQDRLIPSDSGRDKFNSTSKGSPVKKKKLFGRPSVVNSEKAKKKKSGLIPKTKK